MAEGIRKEKSVSPDFDVAVKRHQLLDAIQKRRHRDRQILYRRSSDPCASALFYAFTPRCRPRGPALPQQQRRHTPAAPSPNEQFWIIGRKLVARLP